MTVLGIIAVVLVRQGWTAQKQLTVILAVLLGGVLLAVFGEQVLRSGGIITKGPGGGDANTWVEPTLYLAMIAGMMGKYFFDAIGEGNTLRFQKWQFIKPIFISPIVFGVIYGVIDESTSLVLLFIFASRNGFFWQTVLNKV